MLEFGTKIAGKEYLKRPGAYAVLINAQGEIGLVQNPKGYFLVGGGIEGDETPEEALHREVLEEIGMSIELGEKIGVATQHIYVPEVDVYVTKEGHFYKATLLETVSQDSEDTHELKWLEPQDALKNILHESHRWAVEQVLKKKH